MIVSMTQACGESGIIGIDLYLTDIAEDVIYYEKYKNSYAFIIDMAGIVIWHPSYPRPLAMKSVPYPTNIIYLETIAGFKSVYERMLTEINGTETLFYDQQQIKMVNKIYCYPGEQSESFESDPFAFLFPDQIHMASSIPFLYHLYCDDSQ